MSELKAVFTDETINSLADKALKYIIEYCSDAVSEGKELQKKIALLEAKKNKLFELFYADMIDKLDLSGQLAVLNEEMTDAERRLAEIEKTNYTWITKAKIIAFLNKAKANLESDDITIRKAVIDMFVNEVIVYPDRLALEIRIPAVPSNRDKHGGGEPYLTLSRTAILSEVFTKVSQRHKL